MFERFILDFLYLVIIWHFVQRLLLWRPDNFTLFYSGLCLFALIDNNRGNISLLLTTLCCFLHMLIMTGSHFIWFSSALTKSLCHSQVAFCVQRVRGRRFLIDCRMLIGTGLVNRCGAYIFRRELGKPMSWIISLFCSAIICGRLGRFCPKLEMHLLIWINDMVSYSLNILLILFGGWSRTDGHIILLLVVKRLRIILSFASFFSYLGLADTALGRQYHVRFWVTNHRWSYLFLLDYWLDGGHRTCLSFADSFLWSVCRRWQWQRLLLIDNFQGVLRTTLQADFRCILRGWLWTVLRGSELWFVSSDNLRKIACYISWLYRYFTTVFI